MLRNTIYIFPVILTTNVWIDVVYLGLRLELTTSIDDSYKILTVEIVCWTVIDREICYVRANPLHLIIWCKLSRIELFLIFTIVCLFFNFISINLGAKRCIVVVCMTFILTAASIYIRVKHDTPLLIDLGKFSLTKVWNSNGNCLVCCTESERCIIICLVWIVVWNLWDHIVLRIHNLLIHTEWEVQTNTCS